MKKEIFYHTFALMKKEIYAISLLLSFLVVLGHMMVPHHHHESFTIEYSSKLNQQEAHSHPHNGHHHHSHDDEENDNQADHNSDHGFPQHFHFSATDDFDLVRVNQTGKINYITNNLYLINSELLPKRLFDPPNISPNTFSDFFAKSQYEPGANGLRGPPSIA